MQGHEPESNKSVEHIRPAKAPEKPQKEVSKAIKVDLINPKEELIAPKNTK